MLAYRSLSALVFRDAQVSLLAEARAGRGSSVRGAAGVRARRYVGTGYVRDLADRLGGRYRGDAPDVGIVAILDELAGPDFDPAAVDPLVREFYEHTTRFRSTSCPEWRLWVRPGYLLYRTVVARPLGQANVPMNQRETQRGIRSRIDTITLPGGRTSRSGAGSGRSPTPTNRSTSASTPPTGMTAAATSASVSPCRTAVSPQRCSPGPTRRRAGADQPQRARRTPATTCLHRPGHRELTALAVHGFAEQLDVYVEDGELRADHAFWVFGLPFLVLRYRMSRKSG